VTVGGAIPPGPDALQAIRVQAEEHPLVQELPPKTPREHVLRLMHLRAYTEAVGQAAGRDVLDVGCNTGYGTAMFAGTARRIVGVDVSPGAIAAARHRTDAPGAEFVLVDGTSLPFADATFDLVTSFQVLEHVLDPAPYLREVVRVGRPGASVIFTTPNAATRLDPGMRPWNRFHVREYRAAELGDLLRGSFASVRVRGMFGAPALYETEISAVAKARERQRRLADPSAPAESGSPSRTPRSGPRPGARPRSYLRRLLPAPLRAALRSRISGAKPAAGHGRPLPVERPASPELEAILAYGVSDLFYADEDLDRAMDLLAICTIG
jgi:SAM-dependent methyltransferase